MLAAYLNPKEECPSIAVPLHLQQFENNLCVAWWGTASVIWWTWVCNLVENIMQNVLRAWARRWIIKFQLGNYRVLEYSRLASCHQDREWHLPHVGFLRRIPKHFLYVVVDAQRVVLNLLGMPHCHACKKTWCTSLSKQSCDIRSHHTQESRHHFPQHQVKHKTPHVSFQMTLDTKHPCLASELSI